MVAIRLLRFATQPLNAERFEPQQPRLRGVRG